MCKGLALLYSKDEILLGKTSSHFDIFDDTDSKFVKINLVYDDWVRDGYRIELDDDEDLNVRRIYYENGYIPSMYEPYLKDEHLQRLKEFCNRNKAEIFRGLCRNMSFARLDDDCYIEMDNRDIRNSKLVQRNSDSLFDFQINRNMTVGRQDNEFMTSKIQLNCSSSIDRQSNFSIELAEQDNFRSVISRIQKNANAKIKLQDNSWAEIQDINITGLKLVNASKRVQEFLDENTQYFSMQSKQAMLSETLDYLLKKIEDKEVEDNE